MIRVELPERPVEKFTFDNGLTLIVREDRSAPVVSMQGWCETGSIHEGAWTGAGLSHILEHMLFKGTEARASEQVAREVGSLGGQINAYTSFDRTVYYIDGPSESTAGCLDVLMDVVARATIPADEFEREQEVIRREFAMGDDDPDRVASKELFATAFHTHPYRVPVIGYLDVFNQLERSDVLEYYRARYVPENLFFVVVGDVDAERTRDQVAAFFADIPRRPLAPVVVPEESPQLGRRDAFKEFATPVSKLWMAWKIPGVTHRDMPALDLLAAILGDGKSSRLHREVRERQGAVHRVGAFAYTPADAGLFAISADLDPARREEAEAGVLAQIEALLGDGVSAAEISKARHMALSSQLDALVTARGQAADLGSNWNLTRNLDFTREYLRRVAEVDADEVLRVARSYLVDEGLSVVEVGQGRPAAPAAISDSRRVVERSEYVLDNGLQLIVEPDHRLPLVSMCAAFRGGLLAEEEQTSGLTALLAANLFQGTASRDAAELAEAIESLGGSAAAGGGNNSFFVNAGLMAPETAVAFEVVGEVLSTPSFPDEALSREREAQLALIDEESDRPMGAAMIAAREALFRGHPYGRTRTGLREAVEAMGVERLREFHGRYAVARNGVLSVCGDIEPERARDLAAQHFGAIPCGERAFDDVAAPEWPTGSAEVTIQRDKEQAVVLVAVPGIDLANPDRAALDLVEEACSGMDGRLFSKIREELGLAYYTGAMQLIGMTRGALLFYVGTRPDAADDVAAELVSEIQKLAASGVGDDELSRVKRVYAGRHSIEKQGHGARAQAAALSALYGLGADHDERMLEEVHTLDKAQVDAVAARYLGGDVRVCVKVAP